MHQMYSCGAAIPGARAKGIPEGIELHEPLQALLSISQEKGNPFCLIASCSVVRNDTFLEEGRWNHSLLSQVPEYVCVESRQRNDNVNCAPALCQFYDFFYLHGDTLSMVY